MIRRTFYVYITYSLTFVGLVSELTMYIAGALTGDWRCSEVS